MSGCTSMVFTRTCDATRLLALILRNLNIRAIPISGQMTQVCYTNSDFLCRSEAYSLPSHHPFYTALEYICSSLTEHNWQSKRLGALNKFKSGECNVLVCTDVASRGLDIPSVDMVINYDIPTNSKVRHQAFSILFYFISRYFKLLGPFMHFY